MSYTIGDLIDVAALQRLVDGFCGATGAATAVVDPEGHPIVEVSWQRLCREYCLAHSDHRPECLRSDGEAAAPAGGDAVTICQCPHGLSHAVAPIRIDGRRLATARCWQFLLAPPDPASLRARARERGFDEAGYLAALAEVPVVRQDRLRDVRTFLASLAEMVGMMGATRLRQQQGEQVLRDREEHFRAISAAARDAIVVVDDAGRTRFWNAAASECFGYTEAEAQGRPVHDLVAPEQYRVAYQEAFALFRESGQGAAVGKTIELTARRKDGTELPVELTLSAFRIGCRWHASAVIRDISTRRQAEQTLRDQEAAYRALFDQSPFSVAVSRPNGEYLDVNRRFCEVLGMARDELVGRAPTDLGLIAPGDRLSMLEVLRREGRVQGYEIAVVLPNGGRRVCQVSAEIIEFKGEPAILSIIHDITDKKNVEDALRKSEATLRSLFRAIPVGLTILKDRLILTANDRFSEMFGYESNEIIGRCTRVLYPSDEEFQRAGQALYGNPGKRDTAYAEARLVHRDGSIREVSLSATPLDPDDPSAGVAATVLDITDRKRAEAERSRLQVELLQAQKMETVGRLAGGIAHDLNNLLTPILGYAELSLMKLGPEEARRLGLQDIEEAAKRARDLTHQLLAFSRKQPMELRSVNLSEMVAQFEKILRRTVREDIRLISRLIPTLGTVRGDRGQLQQVLLNLVVNADDAMPSGGTLTIGTDNVICSAGDVAGFGDIGPGPYVRLTVQDTGCGMDAEVQRHLFEPFYTTKPEGKGTGLGLATCYGIVRQHGGFFRVESAPGQGSRFSVYLPQATQEMAPLAAPGPGRVAAGRETVLFIDDARTVRMLLQNILQSLGYLTLEAASPDAALRAAREHAGPIHLLITDVIMPGMNGRQLYEALRGIRPDVKVLYISGYTDDIIAPHGVLEPGTHFLAKPFTLAALSEKVREALSGGV